MLDQLTEAYEEIAVAKISQEQNQPHVSDQNGLSEVSLPLKQVNRLTKKETSKSKISEEILSAKKNAEDQLILIDHETTDLHNKEGNIVKDDNPANLHVNEKNLETSSLDEKYLSYHGRIVKPKFRKAKKIIRWDPVPYDLRDSSDDEFELSTCLIPVYEDNGVTLSPDIVFKNGSPDYHGEIMSCFDDPNLLYRVTNRAEKTWAFYNDSRSYEMHVEFIFGKHSKIEPLDNTIMCKNKNGEYVCTVVVYPTDTEMFIKGNVNGFTSKLRAIPLSETYYTFCRGIADTVIRKEVEMIRRVCSSDNAEEVLQACIAESIPFVDPEFPPCQMSIDGTTKGLFKSLVWARPSMYLPEDIVEQVRLFRAPLQFDAVDFGELGDSWLMCAVMCVAENPTQLLNMFRHPEGKEAAQQEHAVGAYRVTFSKNGWWRSVLVDSYLPVSGGRPKFARSSKDEAEIWLCILQKAYAKLHGGYGAICSGDPLHAIHDLTGFPTTRFDNALHRPDESTKQVFDYIVKCLKAGYRVIFNTPGKDPWNQTDGSDIVRDYKKVGLHIGYAYIVLDVKEFSDINERLVKVRNAAGHDIEWNGDWSKGDPKWSEHPVVAEACNFGNTADGTFWMNWEAALKYFNGGGVCFMCSPCYDYRINCAFYDQIPSSVLEIVVKSPTWFTFVISQEDQRGVLNASEYQPIMISVASMIENDMYKVFLNSSADGAQPNQNKWTFIQARDISLICKLDPGTYLVVPRLMLTKDQPGEVPFVLSVFLDKEVGAGDVAINFKYMESTNRVFENFPKFEPELQNCEHEVQFQKRLPSSGFPETLMNVSL